jgi:exopolyphosphatase / guanosine-5'-triphosphate,3'-diphosphate pyrophosphatase
LKKKSKISAVIDIGSSAIRMLISEQVNGVWRRLDNLEKKTALGSDAFNEGEIGRNCMLECLKILSQFNEVLDGWKIKSEDVLVIGTSALREAQNRDVFLDRVFLRAGFKVRIIEGVEANQLTYAAVQDAMKESWPRFNQANSVVMEVSGGSTEVMLLHRGSMIASHTFQTGTIRIQQQLKNIPGSINMMSELIHDNMSNTLEIIEHEFPLKKIGHFIALGSELRHLACNLMPKKGRLWELPKAKFKQLMEQLSTMPATEIAQKYNISVSDSTALLPLCAVYDSVLQKTGAKSLLIPDVSIRDGLLLSLGTGGKSSKRKYRSQVVASAKSLGRKYHYDESHAMNVTRTSAILFDTLKKEHGLSERHGLLLEVAATLHDIGSFINQSAHHKHSYYIVRSSEIFGLNNDDINIISQVVRYHRKALPVSSHTEFISLDRKVRVVIMKLAAILRVADALDSGHSQRIMVKSADYDDEKFKIIAESFVDRSFELISLNQKADLFEEIYGLKVILTSRSHLL